MILVDPDQDHIISTEKILRTIDQYAEEIALALLPGVQYYSGQFMDIPRITSYAHSKGLTIGWDLAHAAGNVPLKLHDWNVDFAAWCTYKYMNAGPGAIGGLFVHERHGKVEYPDGEDKPVFRHRLTGWYGGDKTSRFQMDNSKSKNFSSPDISIQIHRAPCLTLVQSSDPSPEPAGSRSRIPPQLTWPRSARPCQSLTRHRSNNSAKSP